MEMQLAIIGGNMKKWDHIEKINIKLSDKREASFRVPSDAKFGNTIHIILEVKDDGKPALTRYQRVILTV